MTPVAQASAGRLRVLVPVTGAFHGSCACARNGTIDTRASAAS